MSTKSSEVGKVEGRGLRQAETFPSTSCVDAVELTSPAPSSSASQVSGSISIQGAVLTPPPVVDVVALTEAGVPAALIELSLKSYERMYAMYCAASTGQSVVSAVSRSRPRRRKQSSVNSVVSAVSRVSSVGAQDFDFDAVAKLVEAYGDGFCYLWFFFEENYTGLVDSLGSCPTLSQLASVPEAYWRSPEQLQSLGVCETRQGTFHVYSRPQSGAVRALTFLRSAQGFEVPWVSAMRMIPCTMPGVVASARVGVGDIVDKSIPLPAPVAVFESDPVFRGCVVGALPTGKVVQFSGSGQQLVGMETRGVKWWALNEGAHWSSTRTVNFSAPRRLPALQGNPDVTWEGFSYLALITVASRPWIIGRLGRSPSVSEVASLPISVFDLAGLRRSSFTCSERGLVFWLADVGVVPDFPFENLVSFASRQAVPVPGTLGAFLVGSETTDKEIAAAREYSRWVVRKSVGVGAVEVRMPFEVATVRLI